MISASKLRSLKRSGYAVAGITRDGVAILKSPRGNSTVTDRQIAAAVASVRSRAERTFAAGSDKKR